MKKSLICITTCNRLPLIKSFIIPYLQFVHSSKFVDFCLALDGNQIDYIEFCKSYNIPLLYSDAREGVGLSKNRVLKCFPNYDYYFFLEDDVELFNKSTFNQHIQKSELEKIHHFSLSSLDFNVLIKDKRYAYNQKNELGFSLYGGAVFNFFTKTALDKVGGWNPLFAKYKRFGHTEHSYRIFFQKLNPTPFVFLLSELDSFIWHDPPHVTQIGKKDSNNLVIPEEQAMIDAKQSYFPLTTLSEFYFNGEDVSIPKLHPDLQKGRYALLKGRDKIKAWGNFYFHKYKATNNLFYFLIGFILFPNNNLLKHYMKTKLKAWKNNP